MSKEPEKKSEGLWDSIKGMLSGGGETKESVAGLDKTKVKLNELKDQLNVLTETTIDEFLTTQLKPAFEADMTELGITDAAKKEKIWNEIVKEIKDHLLENSSEKKDIDNFMRDMENFGELKGDIDAKKAETLVAKVPFGKEIGEILANWAAELKKGGGLGILFGSIVGKFASLFGKVSKGIAEGIEMIMSTVKDKFAAKMDPTVALNPGTLTTGLEALAKENIKDDKLTKLVDTALAENSRFMTLRKAISTHESGEKTSKIGKFEFNITDILFQENFSENNVNSLIKAIKGEKEATYKLPEGNLKGVRTLLNAAIEAKNENMETALVAKFPLVAPATPAPTVAQADASGTPTTPETTA